MNYKNILVNQVIQLVEFGWDLENAHKELITLNPTEIAKVGLDFGYLLQKRKNSNGNYNAMLGFITGFKVGSSGETYELEVTIKGMGQMPPTMMIQKPIVKEVIIQEDNQHPHFCIYRSYIERKRCRCTKL